MIRLLFAATITTSLASCSVTDNAYKKTYKDRHSNVILVNQNCYSYIHDHAGFNAALKRSNNEFISFNNLEHCIEYGGYLASSLHTKLHPQLKAELLNKQAKTITPPAFIDDFPPFQEALTATFGTTCMNARNAFLKNSSEIPVTYKTNRQCIVNTGHWLVYTASQDTGRIVETKADNIHVGHVVPWSYIQYKKVGRISNYLQYRLSTDSNNLIPLAKHQQNNGNIKTIEYDFERELYNTIGWNGNKNDACAYIKKWLTVTVEYNLLDESSQELATIKEDIVKYCY